MPHPDRSPNAQAETDRLAFAARVEIFLESRSAAAALTRDAAVDAVNPAQLRVVAGRVAEFVDEAIAIVRDRFRPALDCREGCSCCCRKPGVLVSVPELLWLLERVRTTFTDQEVVALRRRAHEYAIAVGTIGEADPRRSVPCPLLVNDRCIAYDVRPLVCRGYNSTDVKACIRAEQAGTEVVPIFAPMKDASDGSGVGVAQTLEALGGKAALVDLGSALHLVLAKADVCDDAVASGRIGFAAAENAELLPALWARVRDVATSLGITVGRLDD